MKTQTKKGESRKMKKKGFAVASLVLGIIGGGYALLAPSIIAIICGHISLVKIKKNSNKYTGRKMTIVGLILGYFGLIMAIIFGIFQGILKVKFRGLGY